MKTFIFRYINEFYVYISLVYNFFIVVPNKHSNPASHTNFLNETN